MHEISLLNKNSSLEVSSLLSLLIGSFGKPKSYYSWKHDLKEIYSIEEYTFCIFKNKTCLATTQIIINTMVIKGSIYRYGLLSDGATHKDYRRLGLFEKILDHIHNFSKSKNIDFIYGSGNEKSRVAFEKLKYVDFFSSLKASKKIRYNHAAFGIYNRLLNTCRLLTIKTKVNIKDVTIGDYVDFYNTQKDNYSISCRKTQEYLSWRLDDTSGDYKCFGVYSPNQDLEAIIVLRISKSEIYIMDIMYSKTYYLNELLKHTSLLAIRNKKVNRINCTGSNFNQSELEFLTNNFKLSQSGKSVLLFATNPEFKIPFSQINGMHYMRIDKNE